MRLFFVVIVIMVLSGACRVLNRYAGVEDDNPVEELAEEIIRAKTGMELDLTPKSEE